MRVLLHYLLTLTFNSIFLYHWLLLLGLHNARLFAAIFLVLNRVPGITALTLLDETLRLLSWFLFLPQNTVGL